MSAKTPDSSILKFDLPVPPELVGDNAPSVLPGLDPAMLGKASLSPTEPVEVRTFQSFVLTYTVGTLGIDDTGGIRIAWRTVGDTGRLQMTDPVAPNFVTADSNGEGRLSLGYARMGGQRPWGEILTIRQHGGYLRPGETITIRLGDRRQGSPGLLIQTFAEAGRDFRVMADVQATGNFYPLPDHQLTVPVVPGPASTWKAVTATQRRPGDTFILGIKAEDSWGNPTTPAPCTLRIISTMPVSNLPETVTFDGTQQAVTIENLICHDPGEVRFSIYLDNGSSDAAIAEAGPVIINDGPLAGYWGDLHGQSGETVGIGRIEDYMNFARNRAFLDVVCHQGNDFQIKDIFWQHLNNVTAAWNEPGRFTAFPGYEWSGNTAVGGDRNVIYAQEGGTLRRCSHALLEDRSGMENDAHTISDLYAALRRSGEDAIIFAHVGGRYANIEIDHDADLETAVEIHSDWGSFEWIAHDSFRLGRRVGIVANSDGHKGRPGASYPGISEFGAYGGLTCFLAEENSREALFDAIRQRHHYATTGCRMHLDVASNGPRHTAMMGDIIDTSDKAVPVRVNAHAASGIERIELRNGENVLETIRSYDESQLGKRVRITWSGAEYRGRGRNTLWRGLIDVEGASIVKADALNRWNPERLFEQRGSAQLAFESVTTGNFAGVDLWLNNHAASLSVKTNHGDLEIRLADLGLEAVTLDCGGLERQITVTRLPDTPLAQSLAFDRQVTLQGGVDNPVWVCVSTEDGHRAWSSPIYFVS